MAKKSMIQREIKRKGLVNKFSRKRKIIKEKYLDLYNKIYEHTS